MSAFKDFKQIKCSNCGYIITYSESLPLKCPKCGIDLGNTGTEVGDKNAASASTPSDTPFTPASDLLSALKSQKKNIKKDPKESYRFSKKERIKQKNMIMGLTNKALWAMAQAGEPAGKKKDEVIAGKVYDNAYTPTGGAYGAPTYKTGAGYSTYTGKKASAAPSEIKPSYHKLSVQGVKVKQDPKYNLDLKQYAIVLNDKEDREYLKFIGLITKNGTRIFASNKRFDYFLQLAINLDFIATSILEGTLDRMSLVSPETGLDEYVFFYTAGQIIYCVYGRIPDKKALWMLVKMKEELYPLLKKNDPDKLDKIDLYHIQLDYEKKIKYILKEYIKLQDVFTDNRIKSLDNFLRIDYFGLSYESIGVISKVITTKYLSVKGLPPMDSLQDDSYSETELLESIITAKIEAIAANTMANTEMMPNWISVKLKFDQYRFLIFSKINNYYYYILAEGNLDYKDSIIAHINEFLEEETKTPFNGELRRFQPLAERIKEFLILNNQSFGFD